MIKPDLFFYRLQSYLKFYTRAKTPYKIHSPFVSDLLKNIVDDRREYYAFFSLKEIRKQLKKDQRQVPITDFGAGSLIKTSKTKTVSEITKMAAIPEGEGQFLFKLMHFLKPDTILEMGTSLGISAMYMSAAVPRAKMITLEGCPNTAQIALENLHRIGLSSVDLRVGAFDQTLGGALKDLAKIDVLYIDGHHAREPLLKYIKQAEPFLHKDSVVIIADIYWSKDMEAGWKEICNREDVRLSLDFYYFGCIFFNEDFRQKSHFDLIKYSLKPWQMGFFS